MRFGRAMLSVVLAGAAVPTGALCAEIAGGRQFAFRQGQELTLDYRPVSPPAEADEPVGSADAKLELLSASEVLLAAEAEAPADAKPPRPKSRDGVGAYTVDNVTAVEYRTAAGIGLGVATNGGLAISQSFVLGRDLKLSVFLIGEPDTRGSNSDEIRSQDSGQTIGLRLKWSF